MSDAISEKRSALERVGQIMLLAMLATTMLLVAFFYYQDVSFLYVLVR